MEILIRRTTSVRECAPVSDYFLLQDSGTDEGKVARCIVISVDYRLGPENPYPAAVQDAKDAFKWLRSKGAHQLPIDVSRLAVGGSSR